MKKILKRIIAASIMLMAIIVFASCTSESDAPAPPMQNDSVTTMQTDEGAGSQTSPSNGSDSEAAANTAESITVAAIAAGNGISFAILPDATLWTSWPLFTEAETTTGFVQVMEGVAHVAVGVFHTAMIKTDGSLWTWGNNWNGQLGDGTTESREHPVHVLDDVVYVSCGDSHTMAIRSDGSL